jgi:small subunit ribosomal protein S6
MREYELVFIVHPELDETAFTEIINRVQKWITDDGGEIVKTDIWGKRTLAYPIRKQREGLYVLLQANINPSSCATLERNLRFLEQVMRFQIIAK